MNIQKNQCKTNLQKRWQSVGILSVACYHHRLKDTLLLKNGEKNPTDKSMPSRYFSIVWCTVDDLERIAYLICVMEDDSGIFSYIFD